jgi:hypothetical protein
MNLRASLFLQTKRGEDEEGNEQASSRLHECTPVLDTARR